MNKKQNTTQPESRYRIEITVGSLKGTVYPVQNKCLTVGRSPEADISISDTLISRHHCRITFSEDAKWYIEDLGSTNGTWLVGQKLTGLAHLPFYTPVRVGKTVFELKDVEIPEAASEVSLLGGILTRRLRQDNLTTPDTSVADGASDSSAGRYLSGVYKFQTVLCSIQEDRELFPKMLTAISSILNLESVYILQFDVESSEFVAKAARSGVGGHKPPVPNNINERLINYVKETRESVAFTSNDSRYVMCVPMTGKQQINGILYIEGSENSGGYGDPELRMISLVGSLAGMAVEYNRMRELNVRNEQLVATGNTAASLSHYIKNILAGLDGCVNLLRIAIDDKDMSLADESWQILSKNHSRLGNVVLDLLNLASEQTPSFSVYDIHEIVNDVYELWKDQLASENIKLTVEKSSPADKLLAEVDSKGIHRILLNLIINAEYALLARKTSSDDVFAGNINISVKLNESGTYVVIGISDNGVGIEASETKKIFDLFISSKGNAGTGLGLAVCKRIVESHGGTISVTSEKGVGSVFTFSLPLSHNESTTSTCVLKRFI